MSTKANAGDPICSEQRGGARGFINGYGVLGSEGRQPAPTGRDADRGFAQAARGTDHGDPSPASGARRTRSERSLRAQLFFGDLVAVSLAWGLPMLLQSRLRPDQSVAVWLAAVVSTLAVIQMARLYRSSVCSEFSRQAVRIIGAAAVGGCVLAASGWLAGSVSAYPPPPPWRARYAPPS